MSRESAQSDSRWYLQPHLPLLIHSFFRPTAGLIDNLWHQPTSLFCQILLSFYLHFALLNNRISKLPFASLFRILLFTSPAVCLRNQGWHELENPRLENVSSWHQYQHHVQQSSSATYYTLNVTCYALNAQHEVLDNHLVYQIYWICYVKYIEFIM